MNHVNTIAIWIILDILDNIVIKKRKMSYASIPV